MKKIQEKELEKLSHVTGVAMMDIQKLYTFGVIDEVKVIDRLIKFDFWRLRASGRYMIKQIVAALSEEYQVAKTRVTAVAYSKKITETVCTKCGRRIKKAEFKRNNGQCDECIIKSIKV